MRISIARAGPAIVAAAALALSSSRALGAPPTDDDRRAAAGLFNEGTKAFAAGAYRVAAGDFESAYARAPHHAPLFNAARSWHRAGELPRAATLYARYLAMAPADARDRAAASAGLAEIGPRLVRFEIDAPAFASVRVDDQPSDARVVYALPGTHTIAASGVGPGGRARSAEATRTAAAGDVVAVALEPRDDAAPPAPLPAAPGAVAAPSAVAGDSAHANTAPPERGDDAPRRGWSPVVVWVGAGLTVMSLAGGVLSELDYASYKRNHPGATGDTLQQETMRLRRSSFLFVTATALAIGTTVAAIWLVDWKGEAAPPPARVRGGVVADERGARLVLAGSF